MRPTMSIHDCCELMRANQISVSEPTLKAMIQAGKFPRWAVPSVDTKTAAPLISRAGFVAWLKDFYKLEEVHGL
nr:MAG TPA: Pyocin activator protein PrtN [Caudoviricetes sp.]